MKLSVWTYEGPPHVGAIRVATAMENVHLVLHAPQGDTYADLLFTMIERRNHRPPVTYTTFQARDLGSDTASLFKKSCIEAYERFKPELLLVGASCTAELIQDDPGGLAETLGLPVPVVPLELPSYQRKENFGADETFFQIVKRLSRPLEKTEEITCNLIGPTALGFRHRDDITEITKVLNSMGIQVNICAPYGATPRDIEVISQAHFNVLMYPETGEMACRFLERTFSQPFTKTVPIGVGALSDFVKEVSEIVGANEINAETYSQLPWYSASVDSTYLTGKRVFIFGDGTHAIAAAKIAKEELGFEVVGLGTYSREMARQVRATAKDLNVEALITNNYLEVEDAMKKAAPELVLGTQMERHSAKRLGIPCSVISTPMHVQDVPARYSPQMGWEGANVIFDDWVHPLMMGLEEHLIDMFKHDFEFVDGHQSHLGHTATNKNNILNSDEKKEKNSKEGIIWTESGRAELTKVPFFVRGKVKTNTEKYAILRGIPEISDETLYDAKAYFS